MNPQNPNPLVSIVIPTFNRADFIKEALDSVFAQTYPNFEVLVVDDGSTDDTRKVLDAYSQDPRLRYFYQENQGQSVARNYGISEAQGEFICFLDSDNRWLPNKLDISVRALTENPGVSVVYGDIITINEKGEQISTYNMRRHSGHIVAHLFGRNFVSMNTTMSRRECFSEMGAFDPEQRGAEDYELWLRFSVRYRFLYIPEFLAEYRVMENQLSSDKSLRFRSNQEIMESFVRRFPQALTLAEQKEGWCRYHLSKGGYHASVGDLSKAAREYWRALRYRPMNKAPWRAVAKLALVQR